MDQATRTLPTIMDTPAGPSQKRFVSQLCECVYIRPRLRRTAVNHSSISI